MGLDEVHVSVFGQEGHQMAIGPGMEENDLLGWCWDTDLAVHSIWLYKVTCLFTETLNFRF